ncbi:MAG: iron-containing alcohol dehydrogenase [Christensenellaceae bacterium]|jgi:alcohol dehydrogenase YqhD (iron-dependent ADH family)|nr:iron-containing alcohol dehydrogenase [Christensenellaceae bacterium]
MTNFNYENKSKIIFGRNDEKVLANEIKNAGAKKVFIHYGQNSIIKSGLLGKVKKELDDAKIKYVEFGGVQANPLRSHALQGIEVAQKNKVDFVLAIGGGSVIDSAKCIAAGVLNKDIMSYYGTRANPSKKQITGALPLGVVLTLPAAGSEGSCASVIKDERNGQKYTIGSQFLRSTFAFINPEFCTTLPKEQIAAGASDILAHMFERYFSPISNVTLTDKLLTGAIQAMFEIAPKVYRDPKNCDAMAEFCLLGTLAHNGMLSMGREPQSWESHDIEMATLSGPNNVAHGAGLAIIFPAWLKHVSKTKPTKILQFSKEVMGAGDIKDGIAKLEAFYKSLGLATTMKEIGIRAEDAVDIAKTAFPKDIVLGGYGQLTFDDIRTVIQFAK